MKKTLIGGMYFPFEEPFGNYTLKMVKEDSDRVLQPRREHQARVSRWREFGMTIVTMGFVFFGVAAFALNGMIA